MQYELASRPDQRLPGYGQSLSNLAYGDLHRRAPCQGRAQDADQQERPQRCYRDCPHHADGWFKEVHVKDIDSHSVRALLASWALLVKIKRDLENHVRGLLKNLGLVIGRAKFNVFAVRAEELIEGRPELIAAIRPLLEARNAVGQQVSELDRKVMKLARHDAQVGRFMTVPGIGPITALAFKATIDDPARFARSRSVGAYVGLTSRRHASGEVDWSGRILNAVTPCCEVTCLKQREFY